MSHLYILSNFIVITFTLLVGVPLTSMAANTLGGSARNVELSQPNDNYALPLVYGQIITVNPLVNTITIKHDQIPNFGMPAMTMSFNVSDQEMLKEFNAGDAVNFSIGKRNGALTIVSLEMNS
ncbi:copper-binding protein [Glaciimonas immobilis]|uniref:Cu/Ag efflux protein CusF n=1 Tax=Glaciimonas immobilis TaxID=728004 RepID=A0A840RSI8_9BURK|nr:copper-binding protein [Glaciimonas immobilis]KAF3997905.1 copper-binding protein [Glaciimonas immobilis]MBB5199439.1 Cu/Ag efflux protein CusF [Glaciimonas immobilis]